MLHCPGSSLAPRSAYERRRGLGESVTSKLSSARLSPSPRALMNASLRVQHVRKARGWAAAGSARSTLTSDGEKNRSGIRS